MYLVQPNNTKFMRNQMNNNPLKQYFRRPAVYMKLPSAGKDYEPGVIDMPETGELPVYPMTAIDEITTRTPDALFNGTALVELVRVAFLTSKTLGKSVATIWTQFLSLSKQQQAVIRLN